MKKYLLPIVLSIPFLSNGQFTKGDKFIGGTFRASSQIDSYGGTTYTYKTFSMDPFVGSFLKENFAVAGQLGYYYGFAKNDSPPSYWYTNSTRGFSTALIARRYLTLTEKFIFSLDGSINFTRGSNTQASPNVDNKTQSYQLAAILKPVLMFFPSPKWGLEAGIGSISYTYTRNLNSGLRGNLLDVQFGIINVGIAYYIRESDE